MEKKQVFESMLDMLKDFSGNEQNQILCSVLKRIQADRLEKQVKLLAECHEVKIAIEDLDKMTRDAVKY